MDFLPYWVLGGAVAGFVGYAIWREFVWLNAELKQLKERLYNSNTEFINHKYDVLGALRVAGITKKRGEPERWVKE